MTHTGSVTTVAPPMPLVRIDCNQLTNEGLAWADRAEVGDLADGTEVEVHDVPSGNHGTAVVDGRSRDYIYLQVDWGSLRQLAVRDDEPPDWMVGGFELLFRGGSAIGWFARDFWRGFRGRVGRDWCARTGKHVGGGTIRPVPSDDPARVAALFYCRRCETWQPFTPPMEAVQAMRQQAKRSRLIRVHPPRG
jgi:hypothetical protein